MDKQNIWSTEEKKNEDGKGGKHLEKENMWSSEEKKKGEGKDLENENVWSTEEKKNGEGKGGKYLVLRGGKIWTQKRSKIFGEGKYL